MKNDMLDDYVILNNLDGFRAKLQSMEVYCSETQRDNRQLCEKMLRREKKYQRLKNENGGLKVDKVRLEMEIVNLKSQLDVYKGLLNNTFLMTGGSWHQHNVLVNRPTTNNIQSAVEKPLPPPPPPVADSISTQTVRNPARMDNVMDELRNKIKLINAYDE